MAQLSSSSIKDSHLLFLGAVAHQLSLTMMFPSFKMTGSVKGKNLKYMFLLLSDKKTRTSCQTREAEMMMMKTSGLLDTEFTMNKKKSSVYRSY